MRFYLCFAMLVSVYCSTAFGQQGEGEIEYRLAIGDRVRVNVFGHDDLSGEFEVDRGGEISMSLINEVRARGATINELEARIVDALQPDYLKQPLVSVEILQFRPIYILGEVEMPGAYPYVSGMRIVNAVATAGGFTYRARRNRITIERPDGDETIELDAAMGTIVLPGDVIEVPERFF